MKPAAVFTALALFAGIAGAEEQTSVPLKEYVDVRIEEQDKRVNQAQDAAQAAVLKAEDAIGERLALLNEFRAQSADRSASFARVDQLEAVKDRVSVLEQHIVRLEEFKATNTRVGVLESSRDRIYGAILLLGLIGVANLVKVFWGK